MKTKTCFKCNISQPLVNFYAHPGTLDGHLGKCKSCAKLDTRNNYESNRQGIAEYEAKRQRTPERRKKKIEYQRKHRLNNPEKYKARMAVQSALSRGKITNPGCRICGNKAQAHHHDYLKPLDVDWLCFHHHREHGHHQIVVNTEYGN